MSLSVLIKKLRFKNKITEEECDELLKKLKGHDREIYNKAIEDFKFELYNKLVDEGLHYTYEGQLNHIRSVAEGLKYKNLKQTIEQLKENKEVMEECIMCGFYDSNYGCSCPSVDRLYACPIESKKK